MTTGISLFGLLAAVLAAPGLCGVIVATRTREIGIHMALGASGARLVMTVLGLCAAITALGLAVGIPAAMWASRTLSSFLYGLKATDPWTYGGVAPVNWP